MAAAQCIYASRRDEDGLLKFNRASEQERKRVNVTLYMTWLFSCTTISRVYREWSKKREKLSCDWQLCWQGCLVDVRGQRRMGREVTAKGCRTISDLTTRAALKLTEDHTRCPSCQLKTGNWGCSSQAHQKQQKEFWELFPVLMGQASQNSSGLHGHQLSIQSSTFGCDETGDWKRTNLRRQHDASESQRNVSNNSLNQYHKNKHGSEDREGPTWC